MQPEIDERNDRPQAMQRPDDLPAIWLYSTMVDRLRRSDQGWKILARHVGATTTNNRLTPARTDPGYFAPYLPTPRT